MNHCTLSKQADTDVYPSAEEAEVEAEADGVCSHDSWGGVLVLIEFKPLNQQKAMALKRLVITRCLNLDYNLHEKASVHQASRFPFYLFGR